MGFTGSLKHLPKKTDNHISYEYFLREQRKQLSTINKTKAQEEIINNFNAFNNIQDSIPDYFIHTLFIDFMNDTSYSIKSLETLKRYLSSHNNIEQKDSISLEKCFAGMLEKYIKSVSSFFTHREKHQEYSLKSEDFLLFLKKHESWVFDGISTTSLISLYEQELQKYLKAHHKNPFGLDLGFVDEQLRHILQGNIGNGSFTYNWSDGKTNGIEKFSAEGKTYPYSTIETSEKSICEYLFTKKPEIAYHIEQSKNLAELGPGGNPKLFTALSQLAGGTSRLQLRTFLNKKNIKFMDITSDGFSGLKRQLNMFKDNSAEGIEGDFLNKDNAIYTLEDVCYFMFGGTIGNFSLQEIETILKLMQSNQPFKSSQAVITYFEAPDKTTLTPQEYTHKIHYLKSAYGDPDKQNPYYNEDSKNVFEDSMLSGFEALGIPRDALEYTVVYEEKTSQSPARVLLGAKIKRDFSVHTLSGKIFTAKKDETIRATQSIRFSPADFSSLLKKCGFTELISQSTHELSQNNPESLDLTVSVIQSKIGIRNEKHQKSRSLLYGALIGLSLLGSGYTTKQILNKKQNSIQMEKIKEHEQQLLHNKSLIEMDYIWGVETLSYTLADEFISFYGIGDFTETTIQEKIKLYLKDFSDGQAFLRQMNRNPKDSSIHHQFLYSFVNTYFYKEMFTHGFENLEPQPFLKGMEKEAIETLKYTGPTKEGYNEQDGYFYIIYDPLGLNNPKGHTNFSLNQGFVRGYIIPHRCKVIDIKIPQEDWQAVLRIQNTSELFSKILSKSAPDKNGYIIIKKLIVGETVANYYNSPLNIAKQEIKKLFIQTQDTTKIGEHTNLRIDKSQIVEYFEQHDPYFQKIWQVFKKTSELSKFKEEIVLKLYGDKKVFTPNLHYSEDDVLSFVENFIKEHTKELEKTQQGPL